MDLRNCCARVSWFVNPLFKNINFHNEYAAWTNQLESSARQCQYLNSSFVCAGIAIRQWDRHKLLVKLWICENVVRGHHESWTHFSKTSIFTMNTQLATSQLERSARQCHYFDSSLLCAGITTRQRDIQKHFVKLWICGNVVRRHHASSTHFSETQFFTMYDNNYEPSRQTISKKVCHPKSGQPHKLAFRLRQTHICLRRRQFGLRSFFNSARLVYAKWYVFTKKCVSPTQNTYLWAAMSKQPPTKAP